MWMKLRVNVDSASEMRNGSLVEVLYTKLTNQPLMVNESPLGIMLPRLKSAIYNIKSD